MSLKYYLESLLCGGIYLICSYVVWQAYIEYRDVNLMFISSVISFFLFPFSTRLIERVALHFTSKDFWHRGIFMDGAGNSGVLALYYGFCFFIAIPVGGAYILYLLIRREAMR